MNIDGRPTRQQASASSLVGAALLAFGLGTAVGEDAPWSRQIGTSDRPVSWGAVVRTPYHYKLSASLMAHEDVSSIPGSADFLEKLSKLASTHPEVILGIGPSTSTFGKEIEGADTYRRLMLLDGAETRKRRVKNAALVVHRALGASGHVYWQVGNEINALSTFGKLDDPSKGTGKRSDKASIAPYVEWILAPTAEALLEAQAQMPRTYARLSIMSGTIASAHRPQNIRWLESLLEYRIRGDYAPTLRGKQVHEVVDVVGIHYLLSRADKDWDATLTGLFDRWVRTGKLDGVFHTEEVGKRYAEAGLGGAVAMKALGRFLHWNSREKPGAERSKMLPWIYWNEKGENNVDQVMGMVSGFLGSAPLSTVADNISGLESYRLTTADGSRMLAILINSRQGAVRLDHVAIEPKRDATLQCAILRPRSIVNVACKDNGKGGVYLGGREKLSPDSVVLIMELGSSRR